MTKTAFTLILKISNFFLFELTLITIFYRFSTNPLPIIILIFHLPQLFHLKLFFVKIIFLTLNRFLDYIIYG